MAMIVGVASRSANAADVCGDRAGWWSRNGLEVVTIADGLGHGPDAAVAATVAIDTAAAWPGGDLIEMFHDMNEMLRPTRGAAVGVATVEWASGQLTYVAVGNTRAALFGARTTYLNGYAGIVGVGYRRIGAVTARFDPGDLLALWTDGLAEQIALTSADRAAPSLDDMASRLLERFARGNDDRCVVVAHLVQS
jgi:negative regulator of sigma-B (phosphoserine phosphatase)